jgi:hypothetical protein
MPFAPACNFHNPTNGSTGAAGALCLRRVPYGTRLRQSSLSLVGAFLSKDLVLADMAVRAPVKNAGWQ